MAQEIADSKLIDTWSSSGLIVKPDISKIIEGWQLGEQPPHEYMNWLQNTFGSKLNHILKNGVASWNNETEYLAGSSVQHNGNVWLCKVTNTNSAPTDANANWKRIITVESLTTVLGGYVSLTENQTIAGVKTFSSTIGGSVNGNAATATKLATARTIGGVSFDGSANINLPGVNIAGNQNTSGSSNSLSVTSRDNSEDANDLTTNSINIWGSGGINLPFSASKILHIGNNSWPTQLGFDAYNNKLSLRTRESPDGTWRAWSKIYTEADPQINITGNAGTVTNGVYTTGNQTIAGVKTFSSSPIVPTATTGTHAVNKDYVDGLVVDRIGLIDYGYVAKPYHIVAFGGEFNRADYPKLWVYLQANPTLVKTQAQWTSEATANDGNCGFFSDGNGTTTFRVPNLDKAFLRPDSRGVGSYQSDAFQGHRHNVEGSYLSVYTVGSNNAALANIGQSSSRIFDPITDGTNGTPRTASETRPKNIAVLPLIVAK